MSLIRNQKYFPSKTLHGKPLLLMCGFGGSIWQAKRLIATLNKAGYDVTAIDYSKSSLSSGDVTILTKLADEVTEFADALAKKNDQPVLLVGISLGALLALNILRRSELFTRGVLITGGDIAKIAQTLYKDKWPQSYEALAIEWRGVNMYTDPQLLRGKHILFVVHPSKKLIDVNDIYAEVAKQQAAGNDLQLVRRDRFDHIGTIIEETIVFPKRTLKYIEMLEENSTVNSGANGTIHI